MGLIEMIAVVAVLVAVPFLLPSRWRGGKWNDRNRLILWAVCLTAAIVAIAVSR